MNVHDLIADFRARDIQLWADGDRLRCNAPVGSLTPEMRDLLQQNKIEILEFLRMAESFAGQQRAIVPLQPHGTCTPVFAVPGHLGDPFTYRVFVEHLGNDQPFFGLQPPGLDGHSEPIERVEDLAAYFAAQILAFQPNGPYIIAGYCAGGAVAFELARHLQERGAPVSFLALFGCVFPTWYRKPRLLDWRTVIHHAKALAKPSSLPERWRYVTERLRWKKAVRQEESSLAETDPVFELRARVVRATLSGARRYAPRRFSIRLALFLPSRDFLRYGPSPKRWGAVAQQTETYFGPDGCVGDKMLLEPHARCIADLFRQYRDRHAIKR